MSGYKGVECQSLEVDNMDEEPKTIPFSRVVGNARLSATGKSLRIHFFEGNRYFILSKDDILYAIANPTTVIQVKEYEQIEKHLSLF